MKKIFPFSMLLLILIALSCKKNSNTPDGVPVLNTPSASDIDSITFNSVIIHATVSDEGASAILAKGICWSTSHQPTIADNKTTNRIAQNQITYDISSTSFTAYITGLAPGTTYYMRVYATNDEGTGYSEEFPVITLGTPAGTVTDVDGNIYNTIQIGGQIWMVENLRTKHYRDSTNIPGISNNMSWSNTTNGAYCYYNNDSSNPNSPLGKLYNWFAVNTGKLAPQGWHVPSKTEWRELVNYLGDSTVAGGKMKATTLWLTPNRGATNSSGFTGLPTGTRSNSDYSAFYYYGQDTYMWSSTVSTTYDAYMLNLDFNIQRATIADMDKKDGNPVRCIKD